VFNLEGAIKMNKTLLTTVIVLSLMTTLPQRDDVLGAEPIPSASAQQVTTFTKQYFSTLPKYKSGNLITQTEVAGLLKEISKKGWGVAPKDEAQLRKRILSDNDFLVKELNRTQQGHSFLHKIRNYPGGIDRLDKIAQMPKGKRDVHAIIYKIPDGDQWIKGMTTTQHGRRMGNSISRWQHDNFNKNTGRLYTVDQLLPELIKIVDVPQTATRNEFASQLKSGSR